jgi:hypothetical protein
VLVLVIVIVRLNGSEMYPQKKPIETEEQTVWRNSHIFNFDYDYDYDYEHEHEHEGQAWGACAAGIPYNVQRWWLGGNTRV